MIQILIADAVSQKGLLELQNVGSFSVVDGSSWSRQEVLAKIGDFQGLVVRSSTLVNQELIDCAKSLKAVVRAGSGVDNIDLNAAKLNQICIMNTPGTNAQAAAEMTFALLLSMLRHIPQAVHDLKQGNWNRSQFVGAELFEKTLGIVGMGYIGQKVASIASGFGMKVLGHDPFVFSKNIQHCTWVDKEELWSQSDIISLHTGLTSQTKNLICKETLDQMKDGVRIVNAARAELIHTQDMIEALDQGKVEALALDVLDEEPPSLHHPFLNHPKVIVTPHLGASTIEAQENVMKQATECLRSYFLDGKPMYSIAL